MFCRDLVLPQEQLKRFKAFRNALLRDLRPRGAMELMLVDRIVAASWKQRRLNRIFRQLNAEQIARANAVAETMIRDLDEFPKRERESIRNEAIAERDETIEKSEAAWFADEKYTLLDRLSRQEHRLEMSIHRAMQNLQNLQKRTQRKSEDVEPEALAGPELADGEAENSPEKIGASEPNCIPDGGV